MKEQLLKAWENKSLNREEVGSKIVSIILGEYGPKNEIPQPYDDILTLALHMEDGIEAHESQEEYESYWRELSDLLDSLV